MATIQENLLAPLPFLRILDEKKNLHEAIRVVLMTKPPDSARRRVQNEGDSLKEENGDARL
jgi:hypothetical protein